MPTRYLPYEAVVQLNRDFGGPGAGVRDEAGLRSALGRIEHTMFGEDLYATVWEKASALTHAIASTQSFSDGNKRTALMATLMFLQFNGVEIRDLPDIQFDTFVRAIAGEVFAVEEDPTRTVERGAQWWESAAVKPSDKVGFALLAQEVIAFDTGTYALFQTPLVHVRGPRSFPFPTTALFQVKWSAFDLGRNHRVTVCLEEGAGLAVKFRVRERSSDDDIDVDDYAWLPDGLMFEHAPTPTSSSLHPGVQPTIFNIDMLMTPHDDGTSWVRIEIEGELFARLPINFQIADEGSAAPDFIPSSLLDSPGH